MQPASVPMQGQDWREILGACGVNTDEVEAWMSSGVVRPEARD
jgi:hypothetical protein